MNNRDLLDLLLLLDGSVIYESGNVQIKNPARLRATIHRLAEVSALESGGRQGLARFLIRLIAQSAGIFPASIHDLYMARGRNEIPVNFTVPAINLRVLAFDSARAVFRAAIPIESAAIIFEIARSEMGYTDQRPSEYVTSILAAAICEGYKGPVFIQGDHYQVSLKRYNSDRDTEIKTIKDLIEESLAAGFFNIDIDTSTLVDLTKATIPEQQELNSSLSAMFTAFIRHLQPENIMVSVGGEIGEVGGQNSTEEELRAYMNGYRAALEKIDPGIAGISKISIQTGTSHGGVVLPDGSIANVSVDFGTLRQLSDIACSEFGLGGAVQHGASTLPENAFGKFVENRAVEVHLATNFQNMFFDRLAEDLRNEMYAFLDEKYASDRKPGMTSEQFYYKTRKNAVGPFKKICWNLPVEKREEIGAAWEEQFKKLFEYLGQAGTRKYIEQTIQPTIVQPNLQFYLGHDAEIEDVSDLAD